MLTPAQAGGHAAQVTGSHDFPRRRNTGVSAAYRWKVRIIGKFVHIRPPRPASLSAGRPVALGCPVQVRPSNRLVTEPSLKTSWMARPMSGAIDSTVSLSKRFSAGMGSVLVTMTSLIREFLR